MTLRETIRLLKSDFSKGMEYMQIRRSLGGRIFFCITPSMFGICLYRFSHFFYEKGYRSLAWLLYLIKEYITGMIILPYSEIGERFFVGHANGTAIAAQIGKNATLTHAVSIGGGRGPGDVGGGEGLPVIGDNLFVGAGAKILGPIKIGNNVTVGAASLVIKDVPDHRVVTGIPAKEIRTSETVEFLRSQKY